MLVDDIASLRESVSLGQEKKEMMAMEVDKARKVKEELDSNLWALNTTKLEITDEANALKEEKNHLVANHHQLEEDRHQVTILREAIRAKIVQNPEGLLEANRQTTAQIEDLNNHINESESRANDQRERKEATQRLEEVVSFFSIFLRLPKVCS
jgi:chromosome segregation ATPase